MGSTEEKYRLLIVDERGSFILELILGANWTFFVVSKLIIDRIKRKRLFSLLLRCSCQHHIFPPQTLSISKLACRISCVVDSCMLDCEPRGVGRCLSFANPHVLRSILLFHRFLCFSYGCLPNPSKQLVSARSLLSLYRYAARWTHVTTRRLIVFPLPSFYRTTPNLLYRFSFSFRLAFLASIISHDFL